MATTEERRVGERRRTKRPVLSERRTGFDRRSEARGNRNLYFRLLRAYRRNPRTILLVLALFTALNLADLVLTIRSFERGAIELNPVMRALFEVHPIVAGIVKMAVGMVVAEVIWTFRRHRGALALSIGITTVMAAILAWHLSSWLPL